MQTLAFYLLKVIACSGVLLLYFRLALRNKRFHYYNRFYLLMAVAASLLLPLLTFNWFTVQSDNKAITLLSVINVQGGGVYTSTRHGFSFAAINWQLASAIAYIIVSLLLIAVLLWRIMKIYSLKKKYAVVNMAEFDFINTDLAQAPFSFLHNLFWREDIDMNEATGRQVLQHELTHIRQKHTWDKLWMQVITSVLWVNPFFWFIQKELYMLHEFIADEKAIENNDGAAFAAMLLTSQYGKNIFSPAQQFSYSPIKRRLFMLTNLTKPRYSYARRLMALPLLAAVVLLFAFKLKANIHGTKQHATNISVSEGNDTVKNAHNPSVQDALANLADTTKPSPLFVLNGYVVDKAVIDTLKPDDIESLQILSGKTATTFYGDKAANGVVMVVLKKSWHPNALGTVGKSSDSITGNGAKQLISEITFDKNNISGLKRTPLYFVNGKNTSEEDVKKLAPDETENITVLKGKNAIDKYGEKGINGVIEITTKNASFTKPNDSIQDKAGKAKELPSNILYIVDGKIVSKQDVEKIAPSDIESVNMLKGKSATDKYGEKGTNGAIEVILKKIGGSAQITITDVKLEKVKPVAKMLGTFRIAQSNGDTIYVKADSIAINPANHKHIENVYQGLHGDSIEAATFPGGNEAWKNYLIKQLHADIPTKKGAHPGTYTTVVSFTVDVDGSISQVKAEKDPGYGTAPEAVRVIQQGPKWVPAKRNGQPVVYRQKQAISFVVSK